MSSVSSAQSSPSRPVVRRSPDGKITIVRVPVSPSASVVSSVASPSLSPHVLRRSPDGKMTLVRREIVATPPPSPATPAPKIVRKIKRSVPTPPAETGTTDAVKRVLLMCRPSNEERDRQIAKLDAKIKRENAARESAERQAKLEAEKAAAEERARIAAETARLEAEHFAEICAQQNAARAAAEEEEEEESELDKDFSDSDDDGIDSPIIVSNAPGRSMCDAAETVISRMLSANLLMYDPVSCKTFARLRNSNIWKFDSEHISEVILDNWADIIVTERTKGLDITHVPLKSEPTLRPFNEFMKFFTLRLPALQIGKNEESTSLNPFDSITFANSNRVYYIDGYFDLAANRFVTREEDPLATTFVRINRLYSKDADLRAEIRTNVEAHPLVKTLREKYLSVFGNSDRANQDYALKTYARAISGNFDKQFNICLGGRNAGKGLMESVLKSTFEQYVTTFSAPLAKPNAADAAQASREVLTSKLYLARLAFSNESQDQGSDAKNSRFDVGALKNWCSNGDAVVCRKMHENETTARVTAMMFLNLNTCPQIAGDSSKTMKMFNFPNTYDSDVLKSAGSFLSTVAKPNENIKKEFSTNRSLIIAMEELIYSFYRPHPVRDEDVPESVRTIREAKFSADLAGAKKNELNQIVSELFESASASSFLLATDVYKLIYSKKTSDSEARNFTFNTHRAEFKEFKTFFDAQKGIIHKKSGGVCKYYGIKLRETPIDADADDFDQQPSATTADAGDLDMDEPTN